jgi:RHS repeat-associated protein
MERQRIVRTRRYSRLLHAICLLLIGVLLTVQQPLRAAEPSLPVAGPGYTGEWQNSDNTVFLRSRSYLPHLGRFLQRDAVSGALTIPATTNRFSYVLNNPLSYTDPSGAVPHEGNLPIFDGLVPADATGRPLASRKGSGSSSTFYVLPDGRGLGVVTRGGTGTDVLLQQAGEMTQLRNGGLPVVDRCIGTYCGRPAWLVPSQHVGLVHSRDWAVFDSPALLSQRVTPDQLEIALIDLRQSQLTIYDRGLMFADVQGIITPNGRFLFDDPYPGLTRTGVNPLLVQDTILGVDSIAQSTENALRRSGRPIPPRPSRLHIGVRTGTYADIVFLIHDTLQLEIQSRYNRRLCNQSWPRRWWGQLNENIDAMICAAGGGCLVPIDS